MLKHLKERLNFDALKDDARKLGVNLITAGIIGLFITHVANTPILVKLASFGVIITGALFAGFRLYEQEK